MGVVSLAATGPLPALTAVVSEAVAGMALALATASTAVDGDRRRTRRRRRHRRQRRRQRQLEAPLHATIFPRAGTV